MNEQEIQDELRRAFRQVVLTLGGIFSIYDADDDLIWAVTRGLDQVFAAHLRSPETCASPSKEHPEPRPRPHPAVVELLASLEPPMVGRKTT